MTRLTTNLSEFGWAQKKSIKKVSSLYWIVTLVENTPIDASSEVLTKRASSFEGGVDVGVGSSWVAGGFASWLSGARGGGGSLWMVPNFASNLVTLSFKARRNRAQCWGVLYMRLTR